MLEQLNEVRNKHFSTKEYDFSKNADTIFKNAGIPTRKNENWRNTNLKSWWNKTNDQSPLSLGQLDSNKIFFSDFSKSQIKDSGLKVESFETLIANKELFNRFSTLFKDDDPIFNYGLSCLQEAVFIEIDQNVSLQKPIEIIHDFKEQTDFHHLFIYIKNGSKATIVEQNNSNDDHNHFTYQYVICEANSNLEHINIQSGTDKVLNFTRATSNKNSFYKNIYFNFTSLLSRNDFKINLMEEGADCHAYGLYTLSGEQHCDNATLINHHAARTYATQLYKGMIDDQGHGIFTGKVFIHANAQQVESNQLNKNLLLSKKAHAQSQPQLEVFADDVKCAHGSTTGQISDEELFYFLSRGLSPKKAKTLLSHAFCNDIVMKISNNDVQAFVTELMEQKFNSMAHVINTEQ